VSGTFDVLCCSICMRRLQTFDGCVAPFATLNAGVTVVPAIHVMMRRLQTFEVCFANVAALYAGRTVVSARSVSKECFNLPRLCSDGGIAQIRQATEGNRNYG
jgi:hypothetical protein